MKKVLGVFAHPDDELLWGWPIMQDKDVEKHLIIISDNRQGYDKRAWQALCELCCAFDIKLHSSPKFESNFYRVPPRFQEFVYTNVISAIRASIYVAVDKIRPDYIFTHNPIGEYGHGDHRLLFNIIMESDLVNVLIGDAVVWNETHFSHREMPEFYERIYYTNLFSRCTIDKEFYAQGERIYRSCGAWSWQNKQVPEKINLYKVK